MPYPPVTQFETRSLRRRRVTAVAPRRRGRALVQIYFGRRSASARPVGPCASCDA